MRSEWLAPEENDERGEEEGEEGGGGRGGEIRTIL